MNYKEKIETAVMAIEDGLWLDQDDSTFDTDSSCVITCIHDFNMQRFYLISTLSLSLDVEVAFHFFPDSEGDGAGYTFSTFSEVGQFIQPYYQIWLDRNGFTLASKELGESPWIVDTLRRKEA